MNSVGRKVLPLVGPLLLLAVWEVAAAADIAPRVLFPPATAVAAEFITLLGDSAFIQDTLLTIYRTLVSLVFSILIGVPFGMLLGQIRPLHSAMSGLIDFLRSVPAPALFPLVLLFLGIRDAAKIAVAVYAASLLLIIQATYGVRKVSRVRSDVLKLERATTGQRVWLLLLPEMAPFVAAGIRLSASLCLVLIVVAEMLMGAGGGLGQRIMDAQAAYLVEELYATIVLTGIMGYLLNAGFVVAERKIVHWAPGKV